MRRAAITLALCALACEPRPARRADEALPDCEPALPNPRFAYSDADAPIPRHFLHSTEGTVAFTDNQPPDNPITNAGATLGRVLFYDTRLSADDRISCASCHRQAFGFGDTARFSAGLHGTRRPRHTMALANARFNDHGRFFWDERAASLEAQVLIPIVDTLEMGMPLDQLEQKLAATKTYPALFTAAFGTPVITRDGMAKALGQFVRSLVSSHSRFDAVFSAGGAADLNQLTVQERAGMRLFHGLGCANCHRTITQLADQASNIGLDLEPADSGAGGGRFKPPALRNVAVRPPYMHDGRFRSLRDVVEFYSADVKQSHQLDPRLRNLDGTPRRLALDSTQVAALVAFLEALTDTAFLHEERFADPFPCHQRITS
jgi:cytochrome c peroxidase